MGSVDLRPFVGVGLQPDAVLSSEIFPPASLLWKESVSLTFSTTVVRRYRCEKLSHHHRWNVCNGIVMLLEHELLSGSYERNKGRATTEGSRDKQWETYNQSTAKTRDREGPSGETGPPYLGFKS